MRLGQTDSELYVQRFGRMAPLFQRAGEVFGMGPDEMNAQGNVYGSPSNWLSKMARELRAQGDYAAAAQIDPKLFSLKQAVDRGRALTPSEVQYVQKTVPGAASATAAPAATAAPKNPLLWLGLGIAALNFLGG